MIAADVGSVIGPEGTALGLLIGQAIDSCIMREPYGIFKNLDDVLNNPTDPNMIGDLLANIVFGGFIPEGEEGGDHVEEEGDHVEEEGESKNHGDSEGHEKIESQHQKDCALDLLKKLLEHLSKKCKKKLQGKIIEALKQLEGYRK